MWIEWIKPYATRRKGTIENFGGDRSYIEKWLELGVIRLIKKEEPEAERVVGKPNDRKMESTPRAKRSKLLKQHVPKDKRPRYDK